MITFLFLLTTVYTPVLSPTALVSPKKNHMKDLDPSIRELVLKIDETNQATQTIKANFTQKKELSLLEEPMTLKGHFYLKKDVGMKFVFDSPENLEIYFTQRKIVSISHNERTASHKKLPKRKTDLTQVLLSEKLDKLLDYFTLSRIPGDEEGEEALLLTPRKRKMKKKFKEIRISFTKDLLVKRVVVWEVDGDRFEVRLNSMIINSHLDDDLFVPKIPEDYESGSSLDPILGAQIGL